MPGLKYSLVCVFAILTSVAWAPAYSANVNAAAQPSFAAGVEAANAGDFETAAQRFEQAASLDSESGTVRYNLGLALSQLAGRELAATCWLTAYAAGNPRTHLRGSILDLIASLSEESRQHRLSLVDLYASVAPLRPKMSEDQDDYLHYRLGVFWLRLKETERAKAEAARMKTDSSRLTKLNEYITRGYPPQSEESRRLQGPDTPYESEDVLSRLARWLVWDPERVKANDEARGRAWARHCDKLARNKPIFADTLKVVGEIADQLGSGSDFEKAHRLVPVLEDSIETLIAVDEHQAFYVRDLFAFIAPAHVPGYSLFAMIVAYIFVILLVVADIMFFGAKRTAMPVDSKSLMNALLFTPPGILLVLYAGISYAATIETIPLTLNGEALAGVAGALIGGFFLVTMFILSCLGLVMILVKIMGASRAQAVKEPR